MGSNSFKMEQFTVTERFRSDAPEPIAVIGMGCRWPGDSETPSELWEYLESKKNSYGDFPKDRINGDAFYHPNGNRPGSFRTKGGCFLKSDVRQFDAGFFGIHPKEVLTLDPAQRKFLEVVYESFESAGVPLHKLSGSKTGTFVGNFNYDHQLMHYRDPENAMPYSVTGSGITILSNRINYIFNLKGPSMTLDTACSSSLYALHLACSAIQTGDCDSAVVGGTNLILTPECQIFSSVLGAVSPTSVCHTFDSRADGYARADGIGALFIKKLSLAVADGDPIRAVIRGTAFNANGRTGGITHPSADGQEACIRRAYERAGGLDMSLTGYFECHGTGTPVGDPIEVSAIAKVFAEGRSAARPLLIGSIKSNMGHSEPSSGIAGVMKAILAIERGVIPPTVGLETLNPNVDLKDGRLKIVTQSTAWPDLPIRRASINSFGYGGSNAHAILESVDVLLPGYRARHQAQASQPLSRNMTLSQEDGSRHNLLTNGNSIYEDSNLLHASKLVVNGGTELRNGDRKLSAGGYRTRYVIPFSAHDDRTVRANYAALAGCAHHWSLPDIANTLSTRRSVFQHRCYVIASIADGDHMLPQEHPRVVKAPVTASAKLGFVFTGQGAQWPQMGRELLVEYQSCLDTIRRLDAYLDDLDEAFGRDWSIEEAINQDAENSIISQAEYAQPVLTALQIMLVNLLSRWNVTPQAVVGHSSGEIAAGYAAGMLTEREAIVAAYLRGKAVARIESSGAMMAVTGELTQIQSLIQKFNSRITIACHNSPKSYTLSGDSDAVLELKETLEEEKIFCRLLQTDHRAYHSPHMCSVGPQYERDLRSLMPKSPGAQPARKAPSSRPIFFSSVYGHAAPWSMLGPSYWRQNLEAPVLFHQGVTEMIQNSPVDVLIEIGPHSALKGPILQLSEALEASLKFPTYTAAMVRGHDSVTDVLTLAGDLFNQGYNIDLGRVNGTENRVGERLVQSKLITDLPRYQWQYPSEVLLYENRWTREWRLRMHPRHDILGSRIPGINQIEPIWRNKLTCKDVPWLQDHRIGQDIVFPSTGYLSMVIEAATQVVELEKLGLTSVEFYEFQTVTLSRALIIPDDDFGVETLLTLRPSSLNAISRQKWRFDFVLTSVSTEDGTNNFTEHCRGLIEVGFDEHDSVESPMMRTVREATSRKIVDASQWYEQFSNAGLCYGPVFQGLSNMFALEQGIIQAQVGLRPSAGMMKGESRYLLHPATLDASLQLSIVAGHQTKTSKTKRAFMPTLFEKITVWPKGLVDNSHDFVQSFANAELKGIRGLSANVTLARSDGQTVLEATGIFLTSAEQTAPRTIEDSRPYTRIVWKPDFDHLTSHGIARLYPPIILSDDAVIPSLNHLALHQLIHFKEVHQKIFDKGSDVPHLQRLLDWTVDKLMAARSNPASPASSIMEYSTFHREQEIERIASILRPISSEARLMCRLYENLPDIYRGEKTGIQVAVQDNLLIDNYETGQVYREGNKRLASIIAMLAHKNPSLRILEVGAGTGSATNEILPALKGDSVWRQYSEYRFTDTTPSFLAAAETRFSKFGGLTFGTFDMEKEVESQEYQQDWDLVVASNVIHATSDIRGTLSNIRRLLRPGGKLLLLELTQSQLSAGLVLGTFSDFWKADHDPCYPRYDGPFLSKQLWQTVLPASGFTGLDFFLDDYAADNVSATVICAGIPRGEPSIPQGVSMIDEMQGISIVYRSEPAPFMIKLADAINTVGKVATEVIPITQIKTARFRRLIFVVETMKPFFLDATTEEWESFQSALAISKSCLWLTSGDLMNGTEPSHAMISGLARGIKTENRSLRLTSLDLDRVPETFETDFVRVIVELESNMINATSLDDDSEFRYKDGLLYVNRLVEDESLCERAKTTKPDEQCIPVSLADLGSTALRLSIEKAGVLSTVYFEPDPDFSRPLPADEVEIKVAFAAVNNKDIAVLTGRHHSDSMSDECSGIISRVGSSVENLKVGDAVYCQSFAKFGNFVRDKASFCQLLEEGDTLEGTATLPIAFSTAIYGLMNLGRLEKGESVLIQSATGAVGLAACQIAHMLGAEIFATVGTKEKKNQLLSMGYGIQEHNILDSRDRFLGRKLLQQTNGKGIDVILCSARGELMHETWRCIADSGRFIEIGRTEVLDGGSLALEGFRRNAIFASFDLEVLSKTKPHITANLMETIQKLKRQGHIKALPLRKFDVANIDEAFMTFTKGKHIGKLVIGYEDRSQIKVKRDEFATKFDPNASYLLVGCLGGLGRSFSTWAIARGARQLTYLSRSGASSSEARAFLKELTIAGVKTSVVTGDVACLADVEEAVRTAARYGPIKGVVQGALTLNDGLFETMSLERFSATVRSRVIGTLNLDKATRDCPLDFFQLWSSWTVVLGTATQSNYLASNAFLDAFARGRRAQGRPCTSLALSQILGVGVVSYVPEYQQAMVRNGFYGNDEEEFLQYCDKGILCSSWAGRDELVFEHDPYAQAHLLVGIEPAGLGDVDRKYPLGDMPWYHDPRLQNLIQATRLHTSASKGKQDGVAREDATGEASVLERIVGKISRLLYIPADDVDAEKSINQYGIDSMVAAELRNWFLAAFGKDVSMLRLLSAGMTVERLATEAESPV